MKPDDNKPEEEKAVFNMALDTLKRLGEILQEIKNLSYKTEFLVEQRQSVKIDLVKSFFVQATPLLDDEIVAKYRPEVLRLMPEVVRIVSPSKPGQVTEIRIKYNEDLGIRLDEILIELQMILQKKGYFMPSADDEGDF